MCIRARLAVLACLVIAMPGCDTEQPQQIGAQVAQVSFSTNAGAFQYDVWERYVDADLDGVPDQFDPQGRPIVPPVQVQCLQVVDRVGIPEIASANSVPWTHSLEILLLKVGETQPVTVSTIDALDEFFNRTPYDDFRAPVQPRPPCTAPEVCTPLGRWSGASRIVMESRYEDLARLYTPQNGIPIAGLFRCPGSPGGGDARLDGTIDNPGTPPFSLTLEKGDTIIVRARKALLAQNGLETASAPRLSGRLTVGGRIVTPAGTSSSTDGPGAGVSFSYTVR
jgi:hypothetical protein